MSSQRFNVTLLDFTRPDSRANQEVLRRMLGLDEAQAGRVLRALPCVIKRDVARDEAEQVVSQLREVGARVEVRSSVTPAAIPASVAADSLRLGERSHAAAHALAMTPAHSFRPSDPHAFGGGSGLTRVPGHEARASSDEGRAVRTSDGIGTRFSVVHALAKGARVEAAEHRASGSALHATLGAAALVLAALLIVLLAGGFLRALSDGLSGLATAVACVLALGLSWLAVWWLDGVARAHLRGNALRVDREQLPELHATFRTLAGRLGLEHVPEIYVCRRHSSNAVALRIAGRRMVVLFDDEVSGSLRTEQPGALCFLLARELAQFALGHADFPRSWMSALWPPLARLDALSADAVALRLCPSFEAALHGLLTLLVGPELARQTNVERLKQQAEECANDSFAARAESRAHHPLLMRRVAELTRRAPRSVRPEKSARPSS